VSAPIAERLEQLDRSAQPSAERFDPGRRLEASVAVLPSAFNPPTLAHQHLLEKAVRAFGLQGCAALLTTRNVDKGLQGAGLDDRIGMLLALHGEWPELAVLASNQARIIDQAEALRRAFPGVSFDFVVGFDTLERLFAPRYYTDMAAELAPFFERHRVLAANRGEARPGHVEAWIPEHTGQFAHRVQLLEIDEFPSRLSSTAVREELANNGNAAHLARSVREYIREHRLYA
jgi:nicotinamide-nucleotide adenylyltransferase